VARESRLLNIVGQYVLAVGAALLGSVLSGTDAGASRWFWFTLSLLATFAGVAMNYGLWQPRREEPGQGEGPPG
jgi:hypothetical protein